MKIPVSYVVICSGFYMITEGQEKDLFWDLLGGKGDYSSSPRLRVRSYLPFPIWISLLVFEHELLIRYRNKHIFLYVF